MQGPALAPTWAAPASSRTWIHGGGQPIVRRAVALMMETAQHRVSSPLTRKFRTDRSYFNCESIARTGCVPAGIAGLIPSLAYRFQLDSSGAGMLAATRAPMGRSKCHSELQLIDLLAS